MYTFVSYDYFYSEHSIILSVRNYTTIICTVCKKTYSFLSVAQSTVLEKQKSSDC